MKRVLIVAAVAVCAVSMAGPVQANGNQHSQHSQKHSQHRSRQSRHNHSWSRYCWFPQYGCYGCYCPDDCCWYYYCASQRCYLPVSCLRMYPPVAVGTNINVNNNNVGTPGLPAGGVALPQGVTPPGQAAS